LIVYSYVGLQFVWAVAAGWAGGVLGVAITYHLGGEVDWSIFHRTYSCTSVLGMGIAYALERQERHSFLQMCMLQISVAKSTLLAQQLEDLSLTDALTGLANRRHLDESLEREWKRASRHKEPLTVMMVDVDLFKPFNDKFGHVAGDQCLRQISTALQGLTHRSGELAARYGGEEFVLLYPMMTPELAAPHAQKLLDQIMALAIPNTTGEPVTVSIGIATCRWESGCDVATLLRQADEALYDAKENGRNRYEVYRFEPMDAEFIAP
jgi:diguanylate cyclase (GGDEF)-like protein